MSDEKNVAETEAVHTPTTADDKAETIEIETATDGKKPPQNYYDALIEALKTNPLAAG